MNSFLAIIVIIFLISGLLGYKRGLVGSIVKICCTLLAMVIANAITPAMSNFLLEKTNIEERVVISVDKVVDKQIDKKVRESLGENQSDKVVEAAKKAYLNVPLTKSQEIKFIDDLGIPSFMKNDLKENNNNDMRNNILQVKDFFEYISKYISRQIINAIAYVLAFALVRVIFEMLFIIAKVANKLPLISQANRAGGLVFGLLQGLLIVWLIFVAVAMLSHTEIGVSLYKNIEDSKVLTALYDSDVFLKLLGKI